MDKRESVGEGGYLEGLEFSSVAVIVAVWRAGGVPACRTKVEKTSYIIDRAQAADSVSECGLRKPIVNGHGQGLKKSMPVACQHAHHSVQHAGQKRTRSVYVQAGCIHYSWRSPIPTLRHYSSQM